MKPKYKIHDKVWTYHEGAHFSPLLATIEEAKKDLLNKIEGKLLVFSAYGKNREEINLG